MKNANLFLLVLLLVGSCQPSSVSSNFKQLLSKSEYTLVMFIAPDCPLCKTLSTPFSELDNKYANFQGIGIISGNYYSPMEINHFATETKFKAAIFRDYSHQIARQLKATVTPEFYILNNEGEILYQGMMDDRIERLGSYKQQWKNNYLEQAILSISNNQELKIRKTTPIGCSLEY
jgi:thiol-disulfide isomerase/thioredoxin